MGTWYGHVGRQGWWSRERLSITGLNPSLSIYLPVCIGQDMTTTRVLPPIHHQYCPSLGCVFSLAEPSDRAALSNQTIMPTFYYGINYRLHGLALSPDCVFWPAGLFDSTALPYCTGVELLIMTFTLAFVVLPSLPDVTSHLLNTTT